MSIVDVLLYAAGYMLIVMGVALIFARRSEPVDPNLFGAFDPPRRDHLHAVPLGVSSRRPEFRDDVSKAPIDRSASGMTSADPRGAA